MTAPFRAARISVAANERVAAWPSLTPEQRAELQRRPVVSIQDLWAGGAMLTINGVDRWCPSRRHAEAERDALANP